MNPIRPLFRADHVGSLLRPAALRQAHRQFTNGEISADEFRIIQDTATRHAIKLQEDTGLQSVTDGVFRRVSYWAHFVEVVEGLTVKTSTYHFMDDEDTQQEFLAPHVSGCVYWPHNICGAEFAFLQANTNATPKITLPSPPTMHFWRGRKAIDEGVYADRDEFFQELAQVYREEIADLATRGARYLQIDDVPLAMLCDAGVRRVLRNDGDDPEALIDAYIGLINAALEDRPAGMSIAMHICRGNFKGRWLSSGGYDHIAAWAFRQIIVDTFFLEYDTPRAGDFAPLQYVSEDKSVVLGLVSSKTPDDLRRRIEAASQFLPLDRLGISPQCGFASTVGGNPLSEAAERVKLDLVVKVANSVWGD